jgi:hypothetical protein
VLSISTFFFTSNYLTLFPAAAPPATPPIINPVTNPSPTFLKIAFKSLNNYSKGFSYF